jgi:hypothetical protein
LEGLLGVGVGQFAVAERRELDQLDERLSQLGDRFVAGAGELGECHLLQGAPAKVDLSLERLTPTRERVLQRLDGALAVGSDELAQSIDEHLPSIEAGGLLASLANRIEIIELVENRRQIDPEERFAAATITGAGIQLVTVWQSKAQLDQAAKTPTTC